MSLRVRTVAAATALVALGVVVGFHDGHAAGKIRVVASLPDLKSLTEAVGGDLVDVETLARSSQNAHDVELRPSLMVKLRRADLLVINGLELDYWIDPLVRGAGNPRLLAGAAGRVDASRGVPVLDVPGGPVDRSMGDVHPHGNPHYTLDPALAGIVTATILEGLVGVAPERRAVFESRRLAFLQRLDAARARWHDTLAPFKGSRVVVHHAMWTYFLTRFGLQQAGALEERPGIPPSPAHLARLIRRMQDERVKALVVEVWADRKLAERVAAEAGARVVLLAHTVGAVKGTETYIDLCEYNVAALAAALR